MPDLDNLLAGRRSIRRYTTASPPEACLESMVQAAICAPSPRNSQPVRFIRIESPKIRKRLQEAMLSGRERLLNKAVSCNHPKRLRNWINAYWRYSEFIFRAPVLFAGGTITPEGSLSSHLFQAGIITRDKRDDTDLDISIGLALQGFLLKGREFGLGTCVLTAPLAFIEDVGSIFGTREIVIKCFVTVGFPDESPAGPERMPVTDIYLRI
ncbi:MAG: nitroreductase family protein [Syntrophobacterales bacterium]|nr:nitroreductase family protein [Syntrophobacterales bacterium]